MFYALGEVQVSALPYVMTILVALTLCILLIAAAVLLDSDAETLLVRTVQRVRLRMTRMERVLRRRNIDPTAYARAFTVPELKEQIATCKNCGHADLCDRVLESRITGDSHPTFSFCPNQPMMEKRLRSGAPVTG